MVKNEDFLLFSESANELGFKNAGATTETDRPRELTSDSNVRKLNKNSEFVFFASVR